VVHPESQSIGIGTARPYQLLFVRKRLPVVLPSQPRGFAPGHLPTAADTSEIIHVCDCRQNCSCRCTLKRHKTTQDNKY